MTDPFNRPTEVTGGSGFDLGEAMGHLVIVTPLSIESVPTKYGDRDAIRANVTDVDAAEDYDDVLLFGKVMVMALQDQVGKGKVLGRIGQGEARGGNNPPWKLLDFSDTDKDRALAYLAGDAPTPAPASASDDDPDIEALQRKLEEKQRALLESKLGAKPL